MAERRMFAKSIVLSDAFLDMPMSARVLYFTLGMLADDDGFIGNPKSIMRQCGSTEDDMRILLAKRYVLGFDTGIIVIKHWRMNNYLRNDRYTPTTYIEEKSTLTTDEKGAYTEENKLGIPNGYQTDTQVSIGKDSIGKDNNTPNGVFVPSETLDTTKPILYKLPLLDKYHKKYHPIYQEDIDHYKELYPSVDVEQEIRTMIGWLESNPTRQKTPSGIKNFITKWLSKEQNKGKVENGRTKPNSEPSNEPFDYSSIKWYNRPID